MKPKSSCICTLCSACIMVCSMLVLVQLICALFATVTFRGFYFTPEWNTYEILSSGNAQLIPFDPSDCQYFDSYDTYLEVKAPEYTGLTLSLHDDEDVSYSYVINSCYVDADDSCRLLIPRLYDVYAFVALESYDFSTQTIYWGCSYFNTSYFLYLFFILCCGCCCLVYCCSTCIYCFKYFNDSPQHKGTLHKGQLPSTIEDPQRQYHPPEYPRNVPEEAQPLFVATQFETVVKDGVTVHTEVTTVPMLTESGRVEVIENVKLIRTDGTNVVFAEATHGFNLN